ncbi:MAG: DUF4349 domain-containing protein [Chloroflexi bacterium]|nr:DUF4349 domain-containing protein [Chloroflexota bacterium]
MRSRFARIGLPLLLVAAALAACAPAAAPLASRTEAPASGAPAPAPPAAAPADRAVAPAQPAQGGATMAKPAAKPGQVEANVPSVLDRMIIRTAEVKVAVPNVRQAMGQVEQIATLVGGMVFASTFSESQQQDVATVTLRVPPDQKSFQEVLDRIGAIEGARITEQNIRSDDVTEEFTDLEAQLRNLHTTETRLLALLERATKLEDILTLERELGAVRNTIERLEGRKRLLERRAELATIVVTLRQVAPGKDARPSEGWNPFEIAARALAALLSVTQVLATALIWLVIWFPIYAVPLLLLWLLRRRVQQARTAG